MCNSVAIANVPLPVTVGNFPAPTATGALSASVNRVAVNATANVVLVSNPNRKGLIIAVENTVPLYILFASDEATAATVSATNYSRVILNPNNELTSNVWQGFVGVINPANQGGSIQVTELS